MRREVRCSYQETPDLYRPMHMDDADGPHA